MSGDTNCVGLVRDMKEELDSIAYYVSDSHTRFYCAAAIIQALYDINAVLNDMETCSHPRTRKFLGEHVTELTKGLVASLLGIDCPKENKGETEVIQNEQKQL